MDASAGPDVTTYRRASDDGRQLASVVMAGSIAVLIGTGLSLLLAARHLPSVGKTAGEAGFAIALWLVIDPCVMIAARIASGRVEVSEHALTSRNLDGVYVADRDSIDHIELRSRSYGRSVVRVWAPLVRKTDGTAFWLDPLAGGRENQPPRPEQLAAVNGIRAQLRLGGDLVQSLGDPFPYGDSRYASPRAALDVGIRPARTIRLALLTKTVILAPVVGVILASGPPHHSLAAAVCAATYLVLGLCIDVIVLRRGTTSPPSS